MEVIHDLDASERLERELERLPVFPLPDTVLLPWSVMPLHVFEPRYRELVADCRSRDGVLGLATLAATEGGQSDQPPSLHPRLGVGVIVGHSPLEEGRSMIVVQGITRAEIVEELASGRQYRTVRARRLQDHPVPVARAVRELATARALASRLARADEAKQTGASKLAEWSLQETSIGRLSDLFGSALCVERDERLALLDELQPVSRLEQVNRRLAQLVSAIEGETNRPPRAN